MMGSSALDFYTIDRSECTLHLPLQVAILEPRLTGSTPDYLPPMMLLPSGHMADPNPEQRVPIMTSMLFAYAHMRGEGQRNFDPLYYAMYPGFSRYVFPQRILPPQFTSSSSLEGRVQGSAFLLFP